MRYINQSLYHKQSDEIIKLSGIFRLIEFKLPRLIDELPLAMPLVTSYFALGKFTVAVSNSNYVNVERIFLTSGGFSFFSFSIAFQPTVTEWFAIEYEKETKKNN